MKRETELLTEGKKTKKAEGQTDKQVLIQTDKELVKWRDRTIDRGKGKQGKQKDRQIDQY